MRVIENITYDELHSGDYATFTRTLTENELILFAATTGDSNPASMDIETAKRACFKEKIGFGIWAGSTITKSLMAVMPGPGTIHLEQNLKFHDSVNLGDTLTVELKIVEKQERHRVLIECKVKNQHNTLVIEGKSLIVAPTDKISVEESSLPRVEIES